MDDLYLNKTMKPQLNYSISKKAINKTRMVKGSVVMFTCTLIYTCYLHLFISARVFNSVLTSLTVKLMPVFLSESRESGEKKKRTCKHG